MDEIVPVTSARSTGCAESILVERFDEDAGWRWARHRHDGQHQLLWCAEGPVTVETAGHDWLVPPALGLWVPAGVDHVVDGTRPGRLYSLYFDVGSCPIRWTEPTPVAVGDFLRAAIIRLADPGLAPIPRARTESVVYDVIEPVTHAGISVRIPVDPRLRAVAIGLLTNPHDDRDLAAWGREVGASTRTLIRLFSAETGTTFARWRMQVRLRAALAALADGSSVSDAARLAGYRSVSAFTHAFRRVTGRTPSSYSPPCERSAPVARANPQPGVRARRS